jgi:hypothetical protein
MRASLEVRQTVPLDGRSLEERCADVLLIRGMIKRTWNQSTALEERSAGVTLIGLLLG